MISFIIREAGGLERWAAVAGIACLVACAHGSSGSSSGKKTRKPLPSVLGERSPREAESGLLPTAPAASGTIAFVGGTVMTGAGERFAPGVVVVVDGRIAQVGAADQVQVPEGAKVISIEGRFLTPGLIDTHSHMGVYASPGVQAHADGNEMTDPTTPYVFSEHAFFPQDPAIDNAVASGVTTVQILPGSGNVIGGRAVTLKLRPRRETRAMRFPDAPNGLKMACGENPKRVYGGKGRQPMSRMGSVFKLRNAFIKAREYAYDMKAYEQAHARWQKAYDEAQADPSKPHPGTEPKRRNRDLGMETLVDVMAGKIKVHIHCYRADEMLQMLALGRELGFKVSSFHHATDAYKIADVLAAEKVGASVWSDWWGFKMEAYDGVEENAAIVAAIGGLAIIHSDSPIGVQRLNVDAAKALHAGRRAGLKLSEDEALKWVTLNPATVLGIEDRAGSIQKGKMADLVVWDGHPLSIYARPQQVYIDGVAVFSRDEPYDSWSDFDVGTEVQQVMP
ncbi:MAG: amidohydrolase family protein [Myxococcota bacterium]